MKIVFIAFFSTNPHLFFHLNQAWIKKKKQQKILVKANCVELFVIQMQAQKIISKNNFSRNLTIIFCLFFRLFYSLVFFRQPSLAHLVCPSEPRAGGWDVLGQETSVPCWGCQVYCPALLDQALLSSFALPSFALLSFAVQLCCPALLCPPGCFPWHPHRWSFGSQTPSGCKTLSRHLDGKEKSSECSFGWDIKFKILRTS